MANEATNEQPQEEPPTINGQVCEIDPKWEEGGFWDELGFSKYQCPKCKAMLSQDGHLCLNGCHLNKAALVRFNNLIDLVLGKENITE